MKLIFSRITLPRRLAELIGTTASTFLILMLIGFGIGWFKPETAEQVVSFFADYLSSTDVDLPGASTLASFLFLSNLIAAFSAVSCGIVPFLYLPAFSLGTNSMMIGLFGAYYLTNGLGLLTYLVGIVPHGVFEMSALCIACAAGLWLCENTTARLRKKGDTIPIAESISASFGVLLRLAAPLLLLAAIVEAYVTPSLLNLFF